MTVRKKSQKQEKKTAEQMGGKVQIASGAIWCLKADVRTEMYLIENKYTDSSYYSLKKTIWDKINKEAINDGMREPLMQIDIKDSRIVVMTKGKWESLSKGYNKNLILDISTATKSTRIVETIAKKLNNNNDVSFINYAKLEFKPNFERALNLVVISLDNFLKLNEEA